MFSIKSKKEDFFRISASDIFQFSVDLRFRFTVIRDFLKKVFRAHVDFTKIQSLPWSKVTKRYVDQ